MSESHTVTVREAYKEYEPPFNVTETVNRLLNSIPRERLMGLKTVVLSSSHNLSKKVRNANVRQAGRSFQAGNAVGQYHQKWKTEQAWIEIWVDNLLSGWPRPLLWVTFFRDVAVSHTLFHEIGHHVHYTQAPEHKEKEKVAEQWIKRLNRSYYRRRYWWLTPVLVPLWLILKPLKILKAKGKS